MRSNRSFIRFGAEYKYISKLACSFLDSDQFAVFYSLSDSVMIGIHFNSFRFLKVFRFARFLNACYYSRYARRRDLYKRKFHTSVFEPERLIFKTEIIVFFEELFRRRYFNKGIAIFKIRITDIRDRFCDCHAFEIFALFERIVVNFNHAVGNDYAF